MNAIFIGFCGVISMLAVLYVKLEVIEYQLKKLAEDR